MALPELIEMVPLEGRFRAEVVVPGSKSITNRALILAALANGETTLSGALWSDDTQVMVACLQELGYMVTVAPDPSESCNRTLTVYGRGNRVPRGGTAEQPQDLFVGNAGTAARFLAALLCLGDGYYRLHGVTRMHERPQSGLFRALRQLGYEVEAPDDKLPAVIGGSGPRAASCEVSIEESSQFASALILCATSAGWHIRVVGENAEESPYVAMTTQLVGLFPKSGGRFAIEPDASSGSYFWAAGALDPDARQVGVAHWPDSNWQVDQRFPMYCPPPAEVSRERDLGDSIMTAIVVAPFNPRAVRFTHLGRLRVQECERVLALHTELTRCGARVEEHGETLTVHPSSLHGAEIRTYEDHRVAMCFATLGLKTPGIRLQDPGCVRKTFPNFFQKLAAPPPWGLGARILDARTRRALEHGELFAD